MATELSTVERRVLRSIANVGRLPCRASNFDKKYDFERIAYELSQRGFCDVQIDGRWVVTETGREATPELSGPRTLSEAVERARHPSGAEVAKAIEAMRKPRTPTESGS